jgi:CHAT domain-containing protein
MTTDSVSVFTPEENTYAVNGAVECLVISPVHPLVAFAVSQERANSLLTYNYQTNEIRTWDINARPIAFFPCGVRLLAQSYGCLHVVEQRGLSTIPWPYQITGRCAWLDDDRALLAGVRRDSSSPRFGGDPLRFAGCIIDFSQLTLEPLELNDALAEVEIDAVAVSSTGIIAMLERGAGDRHWLGYASLQHGTHVHRVHAMRRSYIPGIVCSPDGQDVFVYSMFSPNVFHFNLNAAQVTMPTTLKTTEEVRSVAYASGNLLVIERSKPRIERQRPLTISSSLHMFDVGGDGTPIYSSELPYVELVSNLVGNDCIKRFAVFDKKHVHIFRLNDPDLVNLTSTIPLRLMNAVKNAGLRRLSNARPGLERLLVHPDINIRVGAVHSLGMIAAPESGPSLVRLLGSPETLVDSAIAIAALDCLDAISLSVTMTQALNGSSRDRLGAIRYLQQRQCVDALDGLHCCLTDRNANVRAGAAHALGQSLDLQAILPLMGALGDAEHTVRAAAVQGLGRILATCAPQFHLNPQSAESIDLFGFAQRVMLEGKLPSDSEARSTSAAQFLLSLCRVLDASRTLDELRNSIERLTTPRADLPARAAQSVGLVVALLFAEDFRIRAEWVAARSTFQFAAVLATDVQSCDLMWRCYKAIAECSEHLGDDREAARAYAQAMEIIDTLWFACLDETKLRGFFAEKARLYDQAALCNLRLGHSTVAFECLEKAKTRYLGDLIARNEKKAGMALARELAVAWRIVEQQTPKPPPVTHDVPARDAWIVTGMVKGSAPSDGVFVRPIALVDLDEFLESKINAHGSPRWALERLWNLAAQIMEEEILTSDEVRWLTDFYSVVNELRLAVRDGRWPMPEVERHLWSRSFTDCIRQPGIATDHLSFFSDLVPLVEGYAAGMVQVDELRIFLEALLEPFDLALGKEPVRGRRITAGELPDLLPGLTFEYSHYAGESTSLPLRALAVERAFGQLANGRWKYVTKLARGESVSFGRSAALVRQQPHTAQLSFAVTSEGTRVFVVSGKSARGADIANLERAEFDVISMPTLTLDVIHERLVQRPDSWIQQYKRTFGLEGSNDYLEWAPIMDTTLQWLSDELWMPLHDWLLKRNVKQLRIIPHRALHLIPFAAIPIGRRFGRVRRLIDAFSLHTAPSVTLYDLCCQRSCTPSTRTSLFTAVCDPNDDLDYAPPALARIARVAGKSVEYVSDRDATREKLSRLELGSRFHFDGHANYVWDAPLDSKLKLHAGDSLTLQDLFAEAFVVHGLDLVALAACETNLVQPDDPADECLGITSGFLFGGARRTLSTLWSVNDLGSALLLPKFYELHISEALPADQALARAQRWLRGATRTAGVEIIDAAIAMLRGRRDQNASHIDARIHRLIAAKAALANQASKPFEHPFFWAGFTISGHI